MQPTDLTGTDPMRRIESIRRRLEGIAGVGALEVDLRNDGSPRLRVRLDGSVSETVVGDEIRRRFAMMASDPEGSPRRRGGLGRGLADILAAETAAPPPALIESPEPELQNRLALVAVEETAGGISVRAADSAGGLAFSPVEDARSLNQAVVSAVGRLRQERPLPRLSGVEVRDVNGSAVLTVVLTRADGQRSVGAALVEGGMPFTLGAAVWDALTTQP